ncbi:c-type cytochrome [Aliivibrio kagoshimensis]|uniref:c-type cytochrome n=1 Tax=Aliivibrio kagoshimensis TaxID=2910230 RepID=UPI003D0D5F31
MKLFALLVILFFSSLTSASQPVGDSKMGSLKIPSCKFCHGVDGKSTEPSYPNLNGQKQDYLYMSMQSYLLGQRNGDLADMMKDQLSKLKPQDIADIAAYYSQLE